MGKLKKKIEQLEDAFIDFVSQKKLFAWFFALSGIFVIGICIFALYCNLLLGLVLCLFGFPILYGINVKTIIDIMDW